MTHSVHALRPAWLLARLRLRRALNQAQAISRYRAGSPDRKAASRTSPTAGLLSALLAVTMLASFTFMAYQAIRNIESALGSVRDAANRSGCRPIGRRGRRAMRHPRRVTGAAAPGSVLSDPVLHAVAFEATLILVTILAIMLAGRDFARPEWDLEWLATLPLPLPTLLLCRLIERVFTSALRDARALALPVGAGMDLRLPLDGAAARHRLDAGAAVHRSPPSSSLVDTGLRLSLSPPKLRNLHAVDFPRQRAAAAPRHGHGHARPTRSSSIGLRRCRTGRCGFRPASRCGRSRPRTACRRSRGASSCWSRFSLS